MEVRTWLCVYKKRACGISISHAQTRLKIAVYPSSRTAQSVVYKLFLLVTASSVRVPFLPAGVSSVVCVRYVVSPSVVNTRTLAGSLLLRPEAYLQLSPFACFEHFPLAINLMQPLDHHHGCVSQRKALAFVQLQTMGGSRLEQLFRGFVTRGILKAFNKPGRVSEPDQPALLNLPDAGALGPLGESKSAHGLFKLRWCDVYAKLVACAEGAMSPVSARFVDFDDEDGW